MKHRRTNKKTNKNDMVLVAGVRTAFCKAGTNLESVPVQELGRVVVRELLDRLDLDPRQVDELIFGCVGQPVDAANVARVIALQAGLPESVPAATVHRNCATGFEALTTAYERMCAGRGDVPLQLRLQFGADDPLAGFVRAGVERSEPRLHLLDLRRKFPSCRLPLEPVRSASKVPTRVLRRLRSNSMSLMCSKVASENQVMKFVLRHS